MSETSNSWTGPTLLDLMSYVEDTHVSPSAWRDDEWVNKTHAICGPMSEKQLANYDPNTQSWKMFGDISLWEEPMSLETLPLAGMTRNGTLFELPLLEQLIAENGSLLWPTPTTHGEITCTKIEAHRRRLCEGMPYSSRITQAIALAYPEDVGYLSPTWTELLMGFPIGWTDLNASETP